MKFLLESSDKVLKLIEVFKIVKSLGSHCTLFCNSEYIYIQCMDGSHICLFDVKIMKEWFEVYECENETISFMSSAIVKILSLYTPKTKVSMDTDGKQEHLNIELEYADGINKYFKLPLMDIDMDLLEPGENDYSMEFTIKTKTMDKYINELALFGESLSIKSKNDKLIMKTSGSDGSSMINVPHENLEEFVVEEDLNLNVKVDLKYISHITKIYCVFKTMNIKVDSQFPLCVSFAEYKTSDTDNSEENTEETDPLLKIVYFVAPKTLDDDECGDSDDESFGENEVIED